MVVCGKERVIDQSDNRERSRQRECNTFTHRPIRRNPKHDRTAGKVAPDRKEAEQQSEVFKRRRGRFGVDRGLQRDGADRAKADESRTNP